VLALSTCMSQTPSASSPGPSEIKRFLGHGVVYHNGVRALDTDYDITITPPGMQSATFAPGTEPTTRPDITGRLLGQLYDAEKLAEGTATLVLEDGRSFDFRVIQPDTNEIVGLTELRPAGARRAASPTEREG
jgi:hypothetical protein